MSNEGDLERPRTRGRPARISRERILSAARGIPRDALTMQRVAEALGVDPKALNYHVGDREGLRQLVALDVFEAELRRIEIPAGGDWREAVRSYVYAFREAVIKVGVLAESIRLPGRQGLGTLGPVERVLQALVDAGLDADAAGRALTLFTDMGYAAGRDALRLADDPVHPDVPGVETALKSASDNDFPVLRQVVAARAHAAPDVGQLEFNLALVIAGLERIASDAHRTS
ncbi:MULTISPECIES: TetR/AcrR family transcriptional regulator C-terminal domain-containing protein [unclassified Mycolicibacterium]|uniref:TetR/AcrR family transcriptional regulator n=1 Tax=unclassified Mycolicibacterium TaxID=2636767 RepID=UPI001F4C4835|nr:TetR/AcrR family transcriptional regulator C-terminal domain-containing protein [Mycolicibacterium sp. YH-1]UNB53862.1 TetR/AcrR family transcriptional regulator C-terminal domain-containing protein [Mycolicibacterium sp. YH-1]